MVKPAQAGFTIAHPTNRPLTTDNELRHALNEVIKVGGDFGGFFGTQE